MTLEETTVHFQQLLNNAQEFLIVHLQSHSSPSKGGNLHKKKKENILCLE